MLNAELQTQEVAPEDLEDLVADIEDDDLGYDVSVIPDLDADEPELDRLRGILRRGQGEPNASSEIASAIRPQRLSMRAIRRTPISYLGLQSPILSLGRVTSRCLGSARSTSKPTCSTCCGCLMGALPAATLWRYACFNITMRTQAANRSSYFFKKDNFVGLTVQ
ncbi:hypothetical protein E4U16_000489 [Claviceps sp. LM84 group G4]|nr:hypothetical protein E4U16_000489 [Claviceps sp. LM84 group G4]